VQLLPDPPACRALRPPGHDAVDQGGAIAQLGERLVCNQKVAGSIPAGSTIAPAACPFRVIRTPRDDASPADREAPAPRIRRLA
jgi:hypothetical protein